MACRINCVLVVFGFSIITRTKGQCSPYIRSVTSPSPSQLKVTWVCNDGGSLQLSRYEYQVNHQLLNILQCQSVNEEYIGDGFNRPIPDTNLGGSATLYEFSATLSNLRPYSSYSISVTSRMVKTETIVTSASQNARTDEAGPTGAPLGVNVEETTATSISVTWQEPACGDRNGNITMYSCSLTNGTDINMEQITPDNNIEYDGLVPYTEYSFTVKARTSAGFGPFGIPLVITTDEDNPPAPKNVRQVNVNISSITFAWSPPDPPHGEIIGYVLEYTKPEERPMRVSVNETSYTLGGLIANDEVSFRVQAETSKGLGPWSKLVTSVAQEGAPDCQKVPCYHGHGPYHGGIIGGIAGGIVVILLIIVCLHVRYHKSTQLGATAENEVYDGYINGLDWQHWF